MSVVDRPGVDVSSFLRDEKDTCSLTARFDFGKAEFGM